MTDFTEMTRAERMKHRRSKLKLSPSYIGQYIGVTRVAYLQWEGGKVKDIAWDKFNKLAEVLLTTPQWLEYGISCETYVANDSEGNIKESLSGSHIVKSSSIPAYQLNDDGILSSNSDVIVDMPAKTPDIYAIQVKHDEPDLRSHAGDALIIDANADLVPGEEVFVRLKSGQCSFPVFNYQKDNEVNLTQSSGKVIYKLDDIDEMSPIVGIARNSYVKKKSSGAK